MGTCSFVGYMHSDHRSALAKDSSVGRGLDRAALRKWRASRHSCHTKPLSVGIKLGPVDIVADLDMQRSGCEDMMRGRLSVWVTVAVAIAGNTMWLVLDSG